MWHQAALLRMSSRVEGPLRVLTLVDTLRPGGAERLATTVARLLDRSRFEPIVCISRPVEAPSPLIDDLQASGVPLLCLERRSRADLAAWRPLLELLRRERVEIVHSHMFGSNVWAAFMTAIAHVPVFVAHVHKWTYGDQPHRVLLDRELVARRADVVLTVSQADRRRMLERGGLPPAKVRVLVNGIMPLAPSRADVRAELGIPADAEVVGTVAVLRREKAHEVLFDAVQLLADEFPRLRVLIAGTGPEERRLRALVRAKGLDQRVLMLGFRRDVPDVLAALDVVLLPSDHEGSPLAVMEAMAAGKPIVATRVGGVPELIEDGTHGLLVPPRDPRALADALGRLLRDPRLREQLGRQARERQSRDFDIATTVRRLETLYEDLTRGARPAR
jgi:glycosyltransferase involved in cell wall biosynthesis